jgi:type IV pilus assembly protein PilB
MRRPKRVLAVDDQPANLVLLKKILEPAGFEVSEARSGAEALAVAQETAPDLILLDMHLPDMHGLDVLRRMRQTTWGTGLRVVAMSALATPEDRTHWVAAGCLGTVEKPVIVKTLVQEISQWLPGAGRPVPESPDGEKLRQGRPKDRLGEILVANLLITPDQLNAAVQVQAKSSKRLGQVLVEQGALSEDDIAWALSNQLGYPYVYLTPDIIDAEAVRLLPPAFLQEHHILPILKFGQEMTLAMADPTDQRTVEEVVERTGLQVKRARALASNIEEMQDRFLAGRPAATRAAAPGERAATEAQYLQFHLVQALQQGASEIHFDPSGDDQARVRYRLQGVLVDRPAQPTGLHTAILRHLRELTGVGDGPVATASTVLTVGDASILLVVTFLPTAAGEAATLALFQRHTDAPDLSHLGVSEDAVRPLRQALDAVSGVVAVGCGDRWLRSTLLHALIPSDARGKIWALETLPVYRRPTLNQTALGVAADAAPYIRGAVEAGADVIVVDETSGGEAQRAAYNAGRTRMVLAGHPDSDVVGLLSETLDAIGPALVASTLRGTLVARSVRLLCPVCKQPVSPGQAGPAGKRTFVPAGCEACGFTGFRGRRLLVDVWMMDAETRRLLQMGRTIAAIEGLLKMGTRMSDQGLALVEDGLTSLDELTRVIGAVPWTSPTS